MQLGKLSESGSLMQTCRISLHLLGTLYASQIKPQLCLLSTKTIQFDHKFLLLLVTIFMIYFRILSSFDLHIAKGQVCLLLSKLLQSQHSCQDRFTKPD